MKNLKSLKLKIDESWRGVPSDYITYKIQFLDDVGDIIDIDIDDTGRNPFDIVDMTKLYLKLKKEGKYNGLSLIKVEESYVSEKTINEIKTFIETKKFNI